MSNFNFFKAGDLVKTNGVYGIVTAASPRSCIINNKKLIWNKDTVLISRYMPNCSKCYK